MEPEWALAYRNKKEGGILDSPEQAFSLIKNTLRYWCADPFLAEAGEDAYVFFEAFDRLKRKGVIGYRKINSSRVGKIKIVIEEPFHLSYPYIYEESGSWYIIPESRDARQIIRYRAKEFPDVWEVEKILADNMPVVDTTVLSGSGDSLQLVTYLFEWFNKGELLVLQLKAGYQEIQYRFADLDGRKRPAGKICRMGSSRYRPSQLCTSSYGEAIIFNKIVDSNGDGYKETEYKTISVSEISLDRRAKISGVHTYNSSDNWEVIDVEIRGFSILRLLGLMPRVYHAAKKRFKKRIHTRKEGRVV